MKYDEWKVGLKVEKRRRNYQHLDSSLDLDKTEDFARVTQLLDNLPKHQFLPFLKKYDRTIKYTRKNSNKPTRKIKNRPLVYASHTDSHIYSYFNNVIQEDYERNLAHYGLSENVIAYRSIKALEESRGKNNIHFAKEAFNLISERENSVVITLDIESFFDELNHKILKENICRVIGSDKLDKDLYKVYKSLTSYRYIYAKEFREKKLKQLIRKEKRYIYKILKDYIHINTGSKGIPQGSPISGLLANIYLIEFDKHLIETHPQIGYRRYSDDLIIICNPGEKVKLLDYISHEIARYKLNINLSKTFVSYFTRDKSGILSCAKVTDGEGNIKNRRYVDYLGFEFDGVNILYRKKTLQKLGYKQLSRTRIQQNNKEKVTRRKPKRKVIKKMKNINYFERSRETINDKALNKQIVNLARRRNKVK